MRSPTPSRIRRRYWLVPLGTLVVAGLVVTAAVAARNPKPRLTGRSASQLLEMLRSSAGHGLSGTVVSKVTFGEPVDRLLSSEVSGAVPAVLSGAHTLQLWYAGSSQQRVSVLGSGDEVDLFRSGDVIWQCVNGMQAVTEAQLSGNGAVPPLTGLALTPPALSAEFLAALDPGTETTVAGSVRVADRSAYQLVVTPPQDGTLVGSVAIAVDGATGAPLQVQVYAAGQSRPEIDVSYTTVTMRPPPADYVTFPTDAQRAVAPAASPNPVDSGSDGSGGSGDADHGAGASAAAGTGLAGGPSTAGAALPPATVPAVPTATDGTAGTSTVIIPARVTGSGWNSVMRYQLAGGAGAELSVARALGMTAASGAWGHGYALQTPQLSMLLVSTGDVLFGAVPVSALYRAVTPN